ncbi:MAG: nucleotide exchange factor GrpE [Prevotellaceae bacterium]|nr:nucleotide exchange factor GrpE [Prevotellaceae bacterium]MDY6098383.1 nucleotide exchange factor GrpE [Bacteroidaceae bacterium]
MKPTEDKEQQPHSEQQENILDEQQQPSAQEGPAQQTEEQEQPVQEEPTTEEQLEKAKEEIAELNDRLLRKIAEFDNYRKRTLKEKTELILNGGEKIITAILPVLDDMERALKNMQDAEDVKALAEGVELIFKKFLDILEKQGVKPIEATGADFDVDLHEAIAQLPAPEESLKGKVLDCTKTGYTLNEKVIRHSQVVVGL